MAVCQVKDEHLANSLTPGSQEGSCFQDLLYHFTACERLLCTCLLLPQVDDCRDRKRLALFAACALAMLIALCRICNTELFLVCSSSGDNALANVCRTRFPFFLLLRI
jgi:hypothetical protein